MLTTFFFFTLLAASVTSAQTVASCAPKDNSGSRLTSAARPSASADGLITCVYGGAGTCVYFANASGLSSGSSDCPGVENKGQEKDSAPPPPPPAKTTSSKEPPAKTTSTSSKATSTSTTSSKTTSTKATSTTSSEKKTSTSSSSSTSSMASSTSSTESSSTRRYRKNRTSSMASSTSTTMMPSSTVYHFTSTTFTGTKTKSFGKEKNFVPSTTTSMASKTSSASSAMMTSSSKGGKKSKTSSTAHPTATTTKKHKTKGPKPTSNAAIKVKGRPSLVPRPTGVAKSGVTPLGLVISNFDDKAINFGSGISQSLAGSASRGGMVSQSVAIGSALFAILITVWM